MANYKFPMEHFGGVMLHVDAYKNMVVNALTNDGIDYTLEVNIPITPDQVDHLNANYNLVEVI